MAAVVSIISIGMALAFMHLLKTSLMRVGYIVLYKLLIYYNSHLTAVAST